MKVLSLLAGLAFIAQMLAAVALHAAPLSAGDVPTVMINGHEAAANRVIVQFKDNATQGDASLAKQRAQTSAARGAEQSRASEVALAAFTTRKVFDKLPGLAVLDLPTPAPAAASRAKLAANAVSQNDTLTLKARMAALLATGRFDFVEPDYIVHIDAQPNDAAFSDGRLWGLRNSGASGGVVGADIGARDAWDITTGSRNVVVAVIDTGIRYTHQELAANMWRNPGEIPANGIDDDHNGYIDDVFGINSITGSGDPMDDNDHGSHVAGTIGAQANGGGPHVGVAWNVRLMALKFLAANGSGSLSGAIECIDYAISKGAMIMSNSWGGGDFSTALSSAITRAQQANILFVVAAGNESHDNDARPSYPASYPQANVVAVAALDRRDQLASFSNYGRSSVDIGAPGVEIFSSTARSDSSYAIFNGTSMAAPHISGVAALLLARFPGMRVSDLKQRLLATAVPIPALRGVTVTGGRVNADAGLRAVADGILEVTAQVPATPLPADGNINVLVSVSDLSPVTGATVTGHFDNSGALNFLDNGVSPDLLANDGVYTATLTVPSGSSTVRLSITASAAGKLSATTSFDYAVASAPDNDSFATRTVIPSGATRNTGSNLFASAETGEPRNPSVAGGRSVWWSWIAATSGPTTITTAGSSFDTTLAVYGGAALDTLSLLGANDDSAGVQSAVTFTAVAGTSYAIQVDGYSGATGAIVLNHPAAGSDSGVPVITSEPGDVTVLLGTPFELSVAAQGEALTYQWLFNDAPISGATRATYRVEAAAIGDGGPYRVQVSNDHGQAISRAATVSVERVIAQPGNDAFAAATEISGSGRLSGSNSLTGGEAGEPDHAGVSQPLASVWYRYVAPSSGTLVVNTAGSNFDTTLAAYTGSAVDQLQLRVSNDDANGVQSRMSLGVGAGEVYYLAVDGYHSAEGNITLDYSFTPDQISVPNDQFDAATAFTGDSMLASNVGASGESGEPNHVERSTPLASVWWRWTAPIDGIVEFNTAGSNFDTTLAVYTGTRVASLTLRDANDDFIDRSSRVRFAITAGQTYSIAVDGYAAAQGAIHLNLIWGNTRPDVYTRYGSVIGANVFFPQTQQLQTSVKRGRARGVRYTVKNRGSRAGRFQLRLFGSRAIKGLTATLQGARGDLSASARAGTLLTDLLQPGEAATYLLKVRADAARTPLNSRYSAYLKATAVDDASAIDQMQVIFIVQ